MTPEQLKQQQFAMVVMATFLGNERRAYAAGSAVEAVLWCDPYKLASHLDHPYGEEWSSMASEWVQRWVDWVPPWLDACKPRSPEFGVD